MTDSKSDRGDPPPEGQPSMRLILNSFNADLPSYEDATNAAATVGTGGASTATATTINDNGEGRIISTRLNTGD